MPEHPKVVVALGSVNLDEAQQRVDAALSLEPEQLITTGLGWVLGSNGTSRATADHMKDYAIRQDLPQDAIHTADQSLDTIGDAVFAAPILRENGWHVVHLVTTGSHLPRSMKIFGHVLGDNYTIKGHSAGDFPARRFQRPYEMIGNYLCRAVFQGTEPGDVDTIKERLFALVPGYDPNLSKWDMAKHHLKNLPALALSHLRLAPEAQ